MDRRCILAVYAHPDDESYNVGGLFRKYHDEGVQTALVSATRGEQGEISDPALATPQTLGQVRTQELEEACRILGIDDLSFLGYCDGGLAGANEGEAVGRIVYHIRRLRPQVVVTFDANGDYGHPDHMAIHRFTLAAFHAAGDPERYPDHLQRGLTPHTPSKLYAHAMAWSVMRKVYRQARGGGAGRPPGGTTAMIPIERMGTPDEDVTTFVPLENWQLAAKIAAIRAHRTQLDQNNPVSRFPVGAVREWLEIERFKLIFPANVRVREDDLFFGVR